MLPEPKRCHNTITTELPSEILFCNILPKLPAKSLLPSMCVSKQWHLFLKTPMFAQTQAHHLTNADDHQNHHKLLVYSTTPPSVFHTIDCEAPENGLSVGRRFPFEAKSITILTSSGGLVCVGITKTKFDNYLEQYDDLILWNPLTGDYKTLSSSHKVCYNYSYDRNGYKLENVFGLYYSSCDDDYKLLCITLDCDAYIYSLRSDAWRKIDSTEELKRIYNSKVAQRWSPCTPVDEKLYFVNYNYLRKDRLDQLTHSILIRFDTKTEKFMVIATPIPGNRYVTCLNHRGCLHLYVRVNSTETLERSVELWRLNGDEDWKKVVSYPIKKTACWSSTNLVHLMRDGKWLTLYNGFFFKVDFATHIKDKSWSYDRNSLYIHTKEKYIETLVSPNRYL